MALTKNDFLESLVNVLAQNGVTDYLIPANREALRQWLFIPEVDLDTGDELTSNVDTTVVQGIIDRISTLEENIAQYQISGDAINQTVESSAEQVATFGQQITGFRSELNDIKEDILSFIPDEAFSAKVESVTPIINASTQRLEEWETQWQTIQGRTSAESIQDLINSALIDANLGDVSSRLEGIEDQLTGPPPEVDLSQVDQRIDNKIQNFIPGTQVQELINNSIQGLISTSQTQELISSEIEDFIPGTQVQELINNSIQDLTTAENVGQLITNYNDSTVTPLAQQLSQLVSAQDVQQAINNYDDALQPQISQQITTAIGGLSNNNSELNTEQVNNLIQEQISQINIPQDSILEADNNILNSWQGAIHREPGRGMFVTTAEEDANFMVAGRGISTLFLGVMDDNATLNSWTGIDIAEWVKLGENNPQTQSYLNAFGPKGAKPGAMILWTSYQGGIGGYLIINPDGSIHTSND